MLLLQISDFNVCSHLAYLRGENILKREYAGLVYWAYVSIYIYIFIYYIYNKTLLYNVYCFESMFLVLCQLQESHKFSL